MKNKSDMASECAAQLKPFGKTLKDATDFYVQHLNRKKSTGRSKGSGAFSGIKPDMTWQDLKTRMKLSHRPEFNRKLVCLLEKLAWDTYAKTMAERDKLVEQMTKGRKLTPAHRAELKACQDRCAFYYRLALETPFGMVAGFRARHIYDLLNKEDKDSVLMVEGHRFASKEDVMDAIHDFATFLRFEKKKARKHKAHFPAFSA